MIPYSLYIATKVGPLAKTKAVLSAFGNHKLKPLGVVDLLLNGLKPANKFFVVDENVVPLLGLPTIQQLDIVKRVECIEFKNYKKLELDEYDDFFSWSGMCTW